MKAVVFAYHNMGIAGLEALLRNGFAVGTIFSHEDDPGEKCWFASVADWARSRNIPVFCPADVNQPEWIGHIAALAPDAIFSFYYRKMLCREILAIPQAGAYNLHGSLLPAYRGRAPVNWVLVNGEKQTGVTLHYMVAKPDAGDVVGQKTVDIAFEDTAVTLYDKLCRASVELLDEVLPLLRTGRAPRLGQDIRKASYFGGRKPEDGRIDWSWTALRIYNLIRAVTDPYPGAFSLLPDGKKFLVWWGVPEKALGAAAAGTVVLDNEEERVSVAAGDGRIRLLDIEINGDRIRNGEIWRYFRQNNSKPVLK